MAPSNSRDFKEIYVVWRASTLCPSPAPIVRKISRFCKPTHPLSFLKVSFILGTFPYLKALFPSMLVDICLLIYVTSRMVSKKWGQGNGLDVFGNVGLICRGVKMQGCLKQRAYHGIKDASNCMD